MKQVTHGGGWPAVFYTFRKAREAGGLWRMWRALRSKNACKTCALGMGGQRGGMVNERGHGFEVCKKSIQAMAADMQGRLKDDFFETFDFESLEKMTPRELEASGRITQPLYAGPLDLTYKTISWDDAMGRIATKLKATQPDDSFFYFSGRSSNEAAFLLQVLARLFGTNNVNNCSYYCHQASGVGLNSVTGSGTATVVLDDVSACDLVFLIGANPASNHPRLMKSLVEVRRRGGTIIVINPLREVGLERFKVPSDFRSMLKANEIANLYVQPHIGGDIALLTGILKTLLEREAIDRTFVNQSTEGWDAVEAHVRGLRWDDITAQCGVSRSVMTDITDRYQKSKKTIFCWAMGITHHTHGVENVQMIANLAIARGMLGKTGCGLLPLRGHSNVQGVGSMGVTPKLKDAIFNALQDTYNMDLPTSEGLDTLGCMERADAGNVRSAICLGGNLYGSNPDSAFAGKALRAIDQVVYLSTTLNTGHVAGRGKETIILPVLARDEESQTTTQESMFNFVRLSNGGKQRFEGPRSEVEVIADLGHRIFGEAGSPLDWERMRDHRTIRHMIAAVVPGYEAIGKIDDAKQEFHIDGRTFHTPTFATPSGRAQCHAVDLPDLPELGDHELRLMTVRSEGQFNTVVYEEEDLYRGQERRDVILMNKRDLLRFGLMENDKVTVRNETGEMHDVLARPFDVPAGNAMMYYPESNVLIPCAADSRSKTPAFKSVIVEIVNPNPVRGNSYARD
ncbi:MAG: FdhF/YdeP family oxidoreductase [Planctomycetota bacterium]